MFVIMPQTPPPFSFGRGTSQGHHRPNFSSPLSSSPIRASSVSPPPPQQQQPQQHQQHIGYRTISQPLSPCGPNFLNTLPRQTQSSPIFPSDQNSNSSSNNNANSKFRFASRNPRPNPVLKRREDVQEGRRRLFFQNVRQRQEDKKWEMRGGEDELLKLEWWRLNRERHQAREAEAAQYLGDVMMDADAVAREEEEVLQLQSHQNVDAMMADAIAQQEEAEMEALVSALEGGEGADLPQHHFSDDEDYDGLFMDLIQQQEGQGIGHSQDVEMS